MQIVKFFFIILLYVFSTSVFSAAPITHVYLGELWILKHENYNNEEYRAFQLGTLFPDIRKLGVISRYETHENGLTTKDIKNTPNPFLKGKRFHAFVDEFRDQLIKEWDIYTQLNEVIDQQYVGSFLKFVEDEILYEKLNCAKVSACLNGILPDERLFGIKEQDLDKWHTLMHQAITIRPSVNIANMANAKQELFGLPNDVLKNWSQEIPLYAKNEHMINYVTRLVDRFNEL
jgi:hypothetical protein